MARLAARRRVTKNGIVFRKLSCSPGRSRMHRLAAWISPASGFVYVAEIRIDLAPGNHPVAMA